MSGRRNFVASRLVAAAAALAAATAWTACDLNDKVAGGSSEVDNPLIVAFTSASGQPLEVTGSLSIYLADQNPAIDPEPLLRKQLAGASSVRLTGADFTQGVHLDSARAYNLLLLSGDSSGNLLREMRFDPRTGRYTTGDSARTSLKLASAPFVRYASTLTGLDTGVVRVFVPGSPFQTVLVDSQFTFESIPAGDLPFRAVVGNSEVRLKRDSSNGGGPRHHVDSTRPPREHPEPPAIDSLEAHAGPDVNLYLPGNGQTVSFDLNGGVSGVNPQDPRVAVLWKQSNDSTPRAKLSERNRQQAKATFSLTGAYRFVFSVSYGSTKREDTVVVSVLPAPSAVVFTAPSTGFIVYLDEPFQVSWYSPRADSMQLQFRPDSGNIAWQDVGADFIGKAGVNTRSWTPSGEPAPFAQLRLVNALGVQQAISAPFALSRRAAPAPPPK